MLNSKYSRFIGAAIIYAGFAVYLYQPYFKNFSSLEYLVVANVCLASLGCFVLSRRWATSFIGSLFAGTLYGFGPFVLGLAKFHPTAGLLAACIPWLFCPAAFGPKAKWQWLSWPLSMLPFLAVPLFFKASAHWRLFAMPTQLRLHPNDLLGLLAPLVAVERGLNPLGFYHIPIAFLVLGFSMLLLARRLGIIIILVAAATLVFFDPFFHIFKVSPIIWLAIPVTCCSVIAGAGMQALASAGPADRKWVLLAAVIVSALAIITLLLAAKCFSIFAGLGKEYGLLFLDAAKMYILAAIALAIIFFMARARLRLRWLRLLILCSAAAIDIFLGARFIVDRIF